MAIATVIIPCGPRHVHLLPRAVRSAYAQTVPVEVLTFIDTEKKGPAYARNRMAERVTTPFIIQLDADDYLLPTFTERLLSAWEPGYYVTSDWYQGTHRVKAVGCYGMRVGADEASFHLPPSLFPTAYWRKLRGQDETLFGAEDTEFYLRCNAARIHHKIVREPLFHYTPDGYRSREASADPRWQELLGKIFGKHRKDMSMGCCGEITVQDKSLKGSRQEGDLIARPNWNATQKTIGRATGRNYGRINNRHTVYIDPRDYAANRGEWTLVEDWEKAAPTPANIAKALKIDPNDRVALLAQKIAQAGIRVSWEPTIITSGYDMQQTPLELAKFLVEMQDRGVQSVLEIGTGDSAGLARFLVVDMGWTVTSVDPKAPSSSTSELRASGRWTFIESESASVNLGEDAFDLVFIDGDHAYDAAKADWEKFLNRGEVVALHDISPTGWYADGVAKFWSEIAYTQKGALRKGFHESIIPDARMGIGWYVHD